MMISTPTAPAIQTAAKRTRRSRPWRQKRFWMMGRSRSVWACVKQSHQKLYQQTDWLLRLQHFTWHPQLLLAGSHECVELLLLCSQLHCQVHTLAALAFAASDVACCSCASSCTHNHYHHTTMEHRGTATAAALLYTLPGQPMEPRNGKPRTPSVVERQQRHRNAVPKRSLRWVSLLSALSAVSHLHTPLPPPLQPPGGTASSEEHWHHCTH